MQYRITDDIEKMMAILPPYIADALAEIGKPDELVEIVIDLGRFPTARYVNDNVVLSDIEVSRDEIDYITSHLGGFDADNRGGIERTLHRISAIKNRTGEVVGLTCRVGRAVFGTIDIIEDIIRNGKSVLILGAPGVGKTTILRESARVLAESLRVVIVDTSNEIGGDGDIPHPAIGLARRMQVASPTLQHEVMIEAVENHNPQVIVIDEIGRELEAQAARTIAERGVQLIGTAHGNSLENLLRNPTLSDLVGGIQAVTLSDEEARRRRTQKTVLERRSPPTFDVLIEMQGRARLVIHHDIASAVDHQLRFQPLPAEMRWRDEESGVQTQTVIPVLDEPDPRNQLGARVSEISYRPAGGTRRIEGQNERSDVAYTTAPATPTPQYTDREHARGNGNPPAVEPERLQPAPTVVHVYAYGMGHNRILEAAKRLGVPIEMVDDMRSADVLVTIKNYYRRRPKLILDAERRGIPIHVLRANTDSQVESFLHDIFQVELDSHDGITYSDDPIHLAMDEVRNAIEKVRGGVPSVDLSPQVAHIRRQQHELVRSQNLASHSYGREPKRYVRVFRDEIN
jgi:stage III sporulation protein AA